VNLKDSKDSAGHPQKGSVKHGSMPGLTWPNERKDGPPAQEEKARVPNPSSAEITGVKSMGLYRFEACLRVPSGPLQAVYQSER
jgi:hypothetical protein